MTLPEPRNAGALGVRTEGEANNRVATRSIPILPETADIDEIAAHIDGTFVLVVQTAHGRYRRRCLLSLKAAQNAARRATDAGHDATILLAELRPVYRVAGGEGR